MRTASALVFLAFVARGAWFFRTHGEILRRQAEAQLEAVARLKVDQISRWRTERLEGAAEISERPLLREVIIRWLSKGDPADRQALLAEFRVVQRREDYLDILLVDPQGNVGLSLAGLSSIHLGAAREIAAAFRERRPVLSELHVDEEIPIPHLAAVAPIFGGHGREGPPLGAVVLVSDAAQFLFPLIQSWPAPSRSAETLLVRRDGDHALFLNDLRHRPDAALKLRIPLRRTDVAAVMAVLGHQGVFHGKDYRGVETVSVLRAVPHSPWFLIAKEDAAEAMAAPRRESALILALLFGFAVLLGAAGLLLWQRNMKTHYLELYRSEAARRSSEERFRVTLTSIADGVIATDTDGRVEILNPVAEVLTGWSQDQARERPLEEVFRIVNEETRRPVESPAARVLREGLVVGLANHTLLLARDGTERPIADSGAPIRGPQGEIAGVVLVFRDQSEERAARRALQESEARYRLLAETTRDIIALHDMQGRLTYLNRAGLAFRGLDPSDVRGRSIADFVPEEALAEMAARRTRRSSGDGPLFLYETEFVNKTGERIPVEVNSTIVQGEDPAAQVLMVARDISERRRSQEELRQSEENFRALVNSAAEGIVVVQGERIVFANPRALDWFETSPEQLVRAHYLDFTHPEDRPLIVERYRRRAMGEPVDDCATYRIVGSGGGGRWVEGRASAVRWGGDPATLVFLIDITDRRMAEAERERLQAQLLQAQKMEAVGRLAGGVAHDFNNTLTTILGYAGLALQETGPESPLREGLSEIRRAGERSAELVRRLLAFARRQTIAPQVVDLNELVEGTLKLLKRMVGEDIDLVWRPEAGLWPVRMDPSQVDQILANLCVNARDAISGVGKVTIETKNAVFDPAYCSGHAGFVPGEYAMLAVSDDGCGMDEDVRLHLFEPFFTTKEVGKGTGLGLPTVYGIVKQNDGFINVYSEPGRGATFRIYLPRHGGGAVEGRREEAEEVPRGRGETILVVEDETSVLRLTQRVLTELGYRVLVASTPGEALAAAEGHPGEIDLLITDVVMPDMNGRELADRLRAVCPGIGSLFMSGYTAEVISRHGVLEEGVHFVEKPFTPQMLGRKVREALGG
jgi:PAS domain S-box-containing protein